MAYAQSDAVADPTPAKEKSKSFAIPKPMEMEHEELHSNLAQLTKAGGRTGEAATAVAAVLAQPLHQRTNLPCLPSADSSTHASFQCSLTEVTKQTEKLEADMRSMLSERKDIAAALKKLKDAATAENKPAGVRFAEHLAAHAQTEEEIIYPTALLIGLYVKSKAAQCAR